MKRIPLKSLGWAALALSVFTGAAMSQNISSTNPTSIPAGSPDFTLTVTGTNLDAVTSLGWGQGYPSTFLNVNSGGTGTQFTVLVPASLLTNAGTTFISACTGGSEPTCSEPTAFAITASAPSVTRVTPNPIGVGAPDTAFSVDGTNFAVDAPSYVGARVLFTPPGGSPVQLTPSFTAPTGLAVTIPAALLATAGTASLRVTNVTDGLTSAPIGVEIRPLPIITSLVLNPTPVGATRALNVYGTNFYFGDAILIGAPGCTTLSCLQPINTTFNSSINLSGSLSGSLLPTPGIYNVYVKSSLGGLSASSPLTVGLTILSLTPTTVFQNATPLPVITITAAGALPGGSTIYFNGQPLTTVVDSSTQLHATLLPANVATLGSFPITVQSGLFSSNALPLAVVPQPTPTITSIAPPAVTSGDPDTLVTITGTNFLQDGVSYIGARVLFTPPGSNTPQTFSPVSNTGTVITVNIPQAQLAAAGLASIAVINVTAAMTSNAATLTIRARPVITSLVLNPTPVGGTIALNVFGNNFANGDRILIGPPGCVVLSCLTAINTTFNSANNLTGSIPGTLIPTAGNYNVFVQNSLGALSLPAQLTVSLTILTLNPSAVAVNVSPVPVLTVTAFGGLTANSVIYFNGQPLTTVFDSPTQVHAQLLAANVSAAGVFPVTVQNGSVTSNALNFTVGNGSSVLTITSLTPNGATVGDGNTTVNIAGTNFAQDARVLFTPVGGTSPITIFPTSISSTLLSVVIPAAQLTAAGTANIAVTNFTAGVTSGTLPFTIRSSPLISAVTPNPASAATTVALVVQGSNFVNGDVILIGAPGCTISSCLQALNTTFNAATNLSASLPGTLIPNEGTYTVYVQNSFGALSNALPLNVRLTILTLNPAFVTQNTTPPTLNVTAAGGFLPGAVISLNGQTLTTVYDSPTQVHAQLSANNIAVAGSYPVTVRNPNGTASNALTFTVLTQGQVTSLTPSTTFAGTGPLTIQLTGTNFQSSDVVRFGNTSLATTFNSAQSLSAVIPANLLTNAGNFVVTVQNLGGASSNGNNFTVTLQITGLSPASVTAGGAAFNLTATLTGGVTESTFLTYAGTPLQTVSSTTTSITAIVPANLIVNPGTPPVFATDGTNTSNTVNHLVVGSLTLISISPAAVDAGTNGLLLSLAGTGFDSGSFVTVNGTPVTTTYFSSTILTAQIPAGALAIPGTLQIGVTTSLSRVSNTLPLTVRPTFQITNLNPATAPVGTVVSMVITGSGFTSVVSQNFAAAVVGSPVTVFFGTTALTGAIVNDTTINVTIPATANSTIGPIPVSVRLPDGRTSNSLSFLATSTSTTTSPFINSITPSAVDLRASGQTLTVFGYNFQQGSVILINGARVTTTYISSSSLSAALPSFLQQGGVSIQVVNPDAQTSNIVTLTVGGARPIPPIAPSLTQLTPSTVAPGGPAFTLTLFGTGLQSNAIVNFGNTQLNSLFVNSGQLTTTVAASLITTAGTVSVSVTNPDGTTTNSLPFVISGKPIITSLTPPSISAGAASFTLGIGGSGFKAGATVSFGGASVPTTFISPNQLTAIIAASLVAKAGAIPVVVTNPDGLSSDPFNFIVNPFALTSISPSSANAGGDSFTLTLTGIGFLNGATASFNGSSLSTNFVSSTSLTAQVPASLIANAGVVNVTVTNPDGALGGPLPFTIKSVLTLISIAPTSLPANSKSSPITAIGTGFVQGATINFNGNPIATTFNSVSSLSGTIPAELLTQTGSFAVTVVNPSGDTSNALSFTVTPALPLPVITSVSPTTAGAGSPPITLTVNGSGFVNGSTVVFGGSNSATTFVSATQLTAVVTANQLSQGGTFAIIVVNPNGDQSNSVTFTIVVPLSITSLSPAAISAGTSSATLVITGAGIAQGATVQFGSTRLTPDSVSPTQISVTLPGSLLAQSGQVSVTVSNPTGAPSNALTFTIVGVPSINISATITPAGTNQVILTLDSPAPVDLTGTLVMTFAASSSNTPANYVDPSLQFAAGGTSINFTIAKGSTTAVLPGNGFFTPGTVAGTLTFTLTRLLAGIDNVLPSPAPSRSFTIAAAAPTITAGTVRFINASSAGFTIEVIGFTTTRELLRANLTFTANASIDGGGSVSVDVTTAFNNYFSSAAGLTNGGAFKLDIPFTISGADANVITGVTVSLTNTAGTSQSISGGR